MKKQGENVLVARQGDEGCRIYCEDCDGYVKVPLPVQGRELAERINLFAREHRHWKNRWGRQPKKRKKQS